MELNDIWATVGDRQVFSGLTLHSKARCLGIIGRNGAGKSSLLRMLQGLLTPQRGTIRLEQPVGLVFQSPDHQILFPTVLEELIFSLTEQGVSEANARQRACTLTERHGAINLLPLATDELSVGQKTLVCILAVLMDEPRTLLLDESFANLDLISARRIIQMIQAGSSRVIFSTHQTHLLEKFDEVIWLDDGALRMQGSPSVVVSAYQAWANELREGL